MILYFCVHVLIRYFKILHINFDNQLPWNNGSETYLKTLWILLFFVMFVPLFRYFFITIRKLIYYSVYILILIEINKMSTLEVEVCDSIKPTFSIQFDSIRCDFKKTWMSVHTIKNRTRIRSSSSYRTHRNHRLVLPRILWSHILPHNRAITRPYMSIVAPWVINGNSRRFCCCRS